MDSTSILLVERTQADLRRTRSYLARDPSLNVIGGCTAAEHAYAFCCLHHPDLVVCELVLAGADGLSLLHRLNRQPDRPLFLLTSGLASDSVLQSATESGVDYFLRKPYAPEQLIEAIDLLHRQKQSANPIGSAPLSRDIYRLLVQRGYTSNMHGFHYLATGVHLGMENPELLSNLTKQLYVQIAEIHHTLASRVERDIRHAIQITCARTGAPQFTNGVMIRRLIRAMCTDSNSKKRR